MRPIIAYPGVPGSFSEGAAREAFPEGECRGYATFPEAAEAASSSAFAFNSSDSAAYASQGKSIAHPAMPAAFKKLRRVQPRSSEPVSFIAWLLLNLSLRTPQCENAQTNRPILAGNTRDEKQLHCFQTFHHFLDLIGRG